MQLAGKYNQQIVAYPQEINPGTHADQHVVNDYTVKRYQQGDHLVWGGPEVGMFWASDIQAELKPQPIEHAYKVVAQANKDLIRTKK
jgi:hypothetical protein